MAEINLSREVQDGLAALDLTEIEGLVDKAVRHESATELRQALSRCGPAIAQKLYYFEKSLEARRNAKAARKREQTAYDVQKEASDLKWVVQAMRDRMETERKNGEMFYVDDNIFWPRTFSSTLSVRITYRWRPTFEDDWKHGAIAFVHEVDTRPNYLLPQPRKPLSPAKQKEALQKSLARDWEHLMRLSLFSVRDYFEAGHDGSQIPDTFQAVADGYTRGLNNFSCDFWGRRSGTSITHGEGGVVPAG